MFYEEVGSREVNKEKIWRINNGCLRIRKPLMLLFKKLFKIKCFPKFVNKLKFVNKNFSIVECKLKFQTKYFVRVNGIDLGKTNFFKPFELSTIY